MDSVAAALLAQEEEYASANKCMNMQRRLLRDDSNPFSLSDKLFVKNFRLNKDAFRSVLLVMEEEFGPSVKSSSVTPLCRLVAVLRFFAEGSYQHGVGKDHDVGLAQSTFSKTLKKTLNILERRLCPVWIRLSMTEEEQNHAKMWFYRKTRFPGVVMCVDGTHIKLLPPTEQPFLYYNRKGYYSINAMVICDHKMQIRYVDARYPGSSHDSHVWNVSDAKIYFEERYRQGDKNTWILGDAGYPLQPWLITPFRSPVAGSSESAFNKTHSKARNIIERVIGVLKNRFRCLLSARQLHYSPARVVQIINVACALHNMCIHYNIEDNTPNIIDEEYEEVNADEVPTESSREASETRLRIMRTLPTNLM